MGVVVLVALPVMPVPGALAAPGKNPPLLWVPIRIRVAVCPAKKTHNQLKTKNKFPNQPVKGSRWILGHVRHANLVLAPHRVRLVPLLDLFFPERCHLTTRAHRHAMARFAPPLAGVPTVLVLRKVRDVDVPDYNLMGVHWRYRGEDPALRGRRYVLLTARGEPPVLAHELCHFFGLPHDPAGGNLMTPGPSSPAWDNHPPPAPFEPKLTPKQAQKLRRGIWRFGRP